MATGTVAVALCLVLAMVALVASIGRARITSIASTRNLRPASGPLPAGTSSRVNDSGTGHVVARFRGMGSGTRGPFVIASPGNFGLLWRYRCPVGVFDEFTVGETDSGLSPNVAVDATGAARSGLSWVSGDTGSHSLVVVSDCRWNIRIVLPGQ